MVFFCHSSVVLHCTIDVHSVDFAFLPGFNSQFVFKENDSRPPMVYHKIHDVEVSGKLLAAWSEFPKASVDHLWKVTPT